MEKLLNAGVLSSTFYGMCVKNTAILFQRTISPQRRMLVQTKN